MAPGINNGQSEVDLHKLEFHRSASAAQAFEPDEQYTGLIQAVLFEVNDRDKIGQTTPQGYRYCCTKELVSKTACHIDRLIVKVRGDADQCLLVKRCMLSALRLSALWLAAGDWSGDSSARGLRSSMPQLHLDFV